MSTWFFQTTYATRTLRLQLLDLTWTAACWMCSNRWRSVSISPNSIRKPFSFTCSSNLPKQNSSPSCSISLECVVLSQFETTSSVSVLTATRSPVRKYRMPSASKKRDVVSSGRFQYPRLTPKPPMTSSPRISCELIESKSTSVFRMGLPIGTPMLCSLCVRCTRDQIVVSVGP